MYYACFVINIICISKYFLYILYLYTLSFLYRFPTVYHLNINIKFLIDVIGVK